MNEYIVIIMNTVNIGIYLTDSKKEGISWNNFLNLCDEYNKKSYIHNNYVKIIDINEHNYNKIKFNKILTKFDEFYAENSYDNKILLHLTSQDLIDPMKNQMNVGNRIVMAEILQEICKNYNNLFIPSYKYLTCLNYCPNLNFPIICKPNDAFGSNTAHDMCVVNDYSSLLKANIQVPTFLQSFHNHDEIIYKIYVVKDKIHVCIKNSISISNENIIYFNTGNLKKNIIKHDDIQKENLIEELQTSIDLISLSKNLSQNFGITLFGYDIIKTSAGYAIIDVNYFPGYGGFDKFHEYLLDLLIEQ